MLIDLSRANLNIGLLFNYLQLYTVLIIYIKLETGEDKAR